jgi:pyrroline-5-carboxylate reductase
MAHTVALVGCGNMGFAMLAGWFKADPSLEAHVVEPAEALRQRAGEAGAMAVTDIAGLPADLAPNLVVLAVKPQMVAPVLAKCGRLAENGATFVSVAAGITIPSMAAALPDGTPIIRCMPNTPASIGEGMMALCAGPGVTAEARYLAETLFSASGSVAWIEDEALMDAVTAISGSGPAYVFHFVEALTAAGAALGLPDDTAALLAKQTVAGAGRMALHSDIPPGTLREQVTSPGGTTAAALTVFMTDERLAKLVAEATAAARDRGVELGKQA